MKGNPLLKLEDYGQGIWLDFLRRGILESGELRRLIDEDGLSGVTSNPAIFEKAINETGDYDDAIAGLVRSGKNAVDLYEELAVEDIQRTADLFRSLYDRTEGRAGFVSLEVSPRLAHDTAGTAAEARRLWETLDRPNVLIKIPGTREGLPAIRQMISEGININVTLLFGLSRYQEVAQAYIDGLTERASKGLPLRQVKSVASFFLSRIDILTDSLLEQKITKGSLTDDHAAALRGQVAIASAKLAYQIYKDVFSGDRFRALAAQGACSQQVLWASTSAKNPADNDLKYVEPLIGPETVNTVPLETLNAYRDHGDPAPRLEEGVDEARRVLDRLPEAGIDLAAVTQQLEDEGVEKFIKPFDMLLERLREKLAAVENKL